MKEQLLIALAQLNSTVGAISNNLEKAKDALEEASKNNADILVFPECFLSGYPAEDLILKPVFMQELKKSIEVFIKKTENYNTAIVFTSPFLDENKRYNAALFIHQGKVLGRFYKKELPNYGVFDEIRVFDQGAFYPPVLFKGFSIGIPICEDIWFPDVVSHFKKQNVDLIICPNASPYEIHKHTKRNSTLKNRIQESHLPIIYVNQIGAQDDLVFDGSSFVMNHEGKVIYQMSSFQEEIAYTSWEKDIDNKTQCLTKNTMSSHDYLRSLYDALVLGLRDYCIKNGFTKVILGLSGGIDSALVAAIAADALGPDNVLSIMMPSIYTSQESLKDAKDCALALKISYDIISIKQAVDTTHNMLSSYLDQNVGITEENLQSGLRGLTLMTISNKQGHLLLATGNKSEYATGYATLYGDMCGGFAVIKDVYKTTVFELCKWRNKNTSSIGKGPSGEVIPENIILKAPTAELRNNQKDEDSLPPYPVLDGILKGLIEEEKGLEALMHDGYTKKTILDVWKLLDRSEYKRRQAAPGIKLTDKSFGKERRYPITNHFIQEIK